MISSTSINDYVDGIPWERTPLHAYLIDGDSYMEALLSVINRTPIQNEKIQFSSDVWDFNPYFEGINSTSYRINFNGLSNKIKEYVKFFALHAIMGKNKIPTVHMRVIQFKRVITNILADKPITILTTSSICDYINQQNIKPGTKHDLYVAMASVLYFIKYNCQIPLLVDIETLQKKSAIEKKICKSVDSKLPNIPERYFNAILSTAVRIMRDNNAEYNLRATACCIVMLSQLGLRINELLAIRTTDKREKNLSKSGHSVRYLHYRSFKPSKAHQPVQEFDIFCTEPCCEAFDTLEKIRLSNKLALNNDYLYVLMPAEKSKNELPISNKRFRNEYAKLLHNELPTESHMDWLGINKIKFQVRKNVFVPLSLPDTRQYRVHLCSTLYNEYNVPLEFIRRYMGHLTEYMMGYYVRPKDTYQEDIAASEKALQQIVGTEDLALLGGVNGAEIKERIKAFIEENHFNVMESPRAVIDAYGDKLIIRGKRGGMCIKTSIMPCSKDRRTNSLYCAYDICPNLFHFFYNADASYADFRTLQATYAAAKESHHTRAAEKELHKLHDLCSNILVPELDELDKEIAKKGVQHIMDNYPTLIPIIENNADIRKEVSAWMSKKD